MIRIDDRLEIPPDEITFVASRGGGPGGQHVNKVATRMTLRFDVANSPSLTEPQRRRLRKMLASRINRDGVLQLSSHAHRSQLANREALLVRFAETLAAALKPPRRRKKTRVPRGSRERRLTAKRQRSEKKQARGRVRRGEE